MNKKRLNFGNFLFEIIPVMIGVFLAFLISNWAENMRNKSKTQLLKKNIIAEINLNIESIENILEYHILLRDSSTYYYQQRKSNNDTKFFKGIRTRILNSSAFETGIQTGLINELSFEQIQSVNSTYAVQLSYNEFSTLLLSGLMTIGIGESENQSNKFLQFLSVSMTDLVIKELELIAEYYKLLSVLNFE